MTRRQKVVHLWQSGTALALVFMGSVALTLVTKPVAAGLFCWKDDNGQTQCGDHVPPQYSSKEREVLNNSGRTVKVLPHEKNEAELAADKRAEQEKQAQIDQARYDQYLLSSFQTETELTKMRDERLAVLDGSIRIGEMSMQNTQAGLQQLTARREQLKSSGKPTPPVLAKQIADQEKRLIDDQRGLETRKQERQALSAKFDRDIVRYRYLKGGTGAPPASSATN